jgi:branched-chain amino acid aminotransferase
MLQRRNPVNDHLIVNINGRLLPRDEAGVSPFDSSVPNGDAVWKGLRLYAGRILRLGSVPGPVMARIAALAREDHDKALPAQSTVCPGQAI